MHPNENETTSSLANSGAQTGAVIELVVAGALWGFGFIAATWMLQAMGPLMATAWRFVLASAVGALIVLMVPRLRRELTWAQLSLTFLPGVFLALTLILQTWGLRYTTATKSGFITTLYVLIVPILERIWLKRRLHRFHFIFVVLALIGVGLICDLPGALGGKIFSTTDEAVLQANRWNIGDFLTLLCSFCASLQILWFAFIYRRIRSSFVFNLLQTLWAAIPAVILALIFEPWPTLPLVGEPLAGLLLLSFGSTLIAFALQVRAQKKISPSLASLLFLLESPFAALFAVYFLDEHLRTEQWIGAGLILAALVLSTIFGAESSETKTEQQ